MRSRRRAGARASSTAGSLAVRVSGAVLAVTVGPAIGNAGPCPPRAEVTGDTAAVARVGAELQRLGVERGPAAPGCRGIAAHVQLEADGGIAVAIRDGGQRSEGRIVSDAAVAASWIDSWLRDDLDGTAWLLATATVPSAPPAAPPSMTAARVPPAPETVAGPSVFERFSFGVAYEQTWVGDGASASGASVAACMRAGRACFGARVRFSSEGDRAVNLTAMSRSDVSALATATLPLAVGRMQIAPELGLGLGRTTTRRIDGCAPPPNCDPTMPNMDPNCQMPQNPSCTDASGNSKIYVGDNFGAATFTPRVAAAVRVAIPLFDHVWLDGIASVGFGPFGHADTFDVTVNPDGTSPGMVMPAEVALPGESATAYVLGVGVRVGSP